MTENVKDIIQKSRELLENNHFEAVLEQSQKGLDIVDDAQLWMIRGIAYYNLSLFEKSLFCINHALNIDPALIEAVELKKMLTSNMEQYDEVLDDFRDPDAVYNSDHSALSSQAVDHKINHIHENRAFMDLHFSGKGHYDEWFEEGYSLYKAKAFDESLLCFENTIELKANHRNAHLYRALALYYLGRKIEAREGFQKASKLFPDFSKLWYKMSLVYFQDRKYMEALEYVNKALDLEPDHPKLKTFKIRVMMAASRLNEALETLKHWLDHEPDQPGLRLLKHEVLILLKGDEALKEIRAELAQDEDDPSLWCGFVSLLIKKSNFHEALGVVNHALELYPEDDELLVQKGEILLEQKKYQEADRFFDHCLEFDDENDYFWYLKGLAALSVKNYDKAIELFNTALEINEEFDKAAFYKAKALVYCNERQMARDILTLLLEKSTLDTHIKHEARYLIFKLA
ncbi:MAG: tetratricopeptide repeat protein [Spirochaetales bacterium]|nr:tetratricopeptide repeat protein [Spirochaetales bacterium]